MGSRYFDWTASLKRFIRFDAARAEDVNDALDELSAGLETLDGDVDRSIKLAAGSADQTLSLSAGARANKVLAFDGSGNVTVSANDVDSSAASAAAAAASASTATTQAGIATTGASTATAQATAAAASEVAAALSATSAAASEAQAEYWAGQAAISVADGVIDDATTGTLTTWSSQKINQTKRNVQDTIQVIGTNTTATASNTYILTASLTLTLPATPSAGDWVGVQNSSGTTTAVIGRNGSNIMSLAEDLTLDANFVALRLTYADATRGWVFGG